MTTTNTRALCLASVLAEQPLIDVTDSAADAGLAVSAYATEDAYFLLVPHRDTEDDRARVAALLRGLSTGGAPECWALYRHVDPDGQPYIILDRKPTVAELREAGYDDYEIMILNAGGDV